ncbi:3'-5' exonuclease [Rhodoferax ferrireducens]|uniref:3'-5' exonuclease n=1 Tax=Rhodoferax ferrireducens TaxID=192843 RepID=UPI003BB5637B
MAVLSRSRAQRPLRRINRGRDGEAPLIIRLPKLRAEATKISDLLNTAHQEDHAWGDMAVLCRHHNEMEECAPALSRWQLPHQVRQGSGSFNPLEDTIKVLTMHASKGLEFPVVALMGVGQVPAAGEDEREEARLFYVGGD